MRDEGSAIVSFKKSTWIIVFAFILHPLSSILAGQKYWQQHVSYDIRVTLIDSIHTLDGSLSVIYSNNSPDTLREVYFHLYANAFQPGSLMDERAHAIHSAPIYNRISSLPEREQGRYWIGAMMADSLTAKYAITGTVMRVALPRPLASGGSVTIVFPFREQVPRQIRRSGWMSREGVQYSMSQWYPKIAEYDNEGWHRQEYVAREFYGVWGDFNVEITAPSRFVIGATGECTNPRDVGHGYDRIAGGEREGILFPTEAAPSITTWHFHASSVHDFAWVADDDYVHEWSTWQDTIMLHAFYKRRYAPFWHDAIRYSRHALETYSELFGPYAYRNFSCTMAGDGGMEYPQLIMITGYRPTPGSMAGVIAHETAHQWFYGMLGSNETREAFMDEGFTSWATTVAMNRLWGDHQIPPGQERSWLDGFIPKFSNKRDNYRGYQSLASEGFEEPLDIPHDWFREDLTAGQVYGKTQAILSMLQYTLGDEVFARGMKRYYNEWHFKHPHLVDFKRVMENVAHTDLDWFFDEWFRTTRTVDYEAMDVSSEVVAEGYNNTLRLRNNNLAVMPIDLLLHYDDGSAGATTIPLVTNKDLVYHKSGVEMFLPGWDWVSPNYEASLVTPKRISWFEIDTSWRLQDLHWLNNYSARSALWTPPGEWAVWKQLFIYPPIDKYYSVVRPILWWDSISKFNAGVGAKFGMNNSFSGDAKLIYKSDPLRDTTPLWYDHLDGALDYHIPVDWLGRLTTFGVRASKMDGIGTVGAELTKVFRPEYLRLGPTHTGSLYLESQTLLNPSYPVYHSEWSAAGSEVAGLTYSVVSEDATERFDLKAESAVWGSSFERAKVKFEDDFSLGGNFGSRIRLTAGTATASTPVERTFWLARASNYEDNQSSFFRAVTDVSPALDRKASAFVEGGAGVRGYAIDEVADTAHSLRGTQMFGVSDDITLPNVLRNLWSPLATLGFGLFVDAGWVGEPTLDFWHDVRTNLRTDAGATVSVNLRDWLPYQLRGVADEYAPVPLIKLVLPLYENLPADGKKPVAFRWGLAIGASL
ncbi:MAG: M1 family metallopeptidase [Bacteroidota bacterium]|nr:M1 family metallopeptidase [Bacteroidota bacterium]MDP4288423.1 M1 family metallopeptidase [Bacteroidota bacterium]